MTESDSEYHDALGNVEPCEDIAINFSFPFPLHTLFTGFTSSIENSSPELSFLKHKNFIHKINGLILILFIHFLTLIPMTTNFL